MQSIDILDGAAQDLGRSLLSNDNAGQLSGFRGILLSLCRYRKRRPLHGRKC